MFFEDTFCLFRSVGTRAGSAYVLCNLAETWRADGDHRAAQGCLEEAVAVFADLGDDPGRAAALNVLGNLARSTGEFELGSRRLEEALAIRRANRDSREIATTLTDLGMLALSAGEQARGRELMDQARTMYERAEDAPGMEGIPLSLGAFELDGGDPERACMLFALSAEICRRRGRLHRSGSWALAELGEAAIATGDLARATEALEEAVPEFERYTDERGLRYANDLQARIARDV